MVSVGRSGSLQKDPRKRDTVAELAAHPWILQYSQADADLETWAQFLLTYKNGKAKLKETTTERLPLNP